MLASSQVGRAPCQEAWVLTRRRGRSEAGKDRRVRTVRGWRGQTMVHCLSWVTENFLEGGSGPCRAVGRASLHVEGGLRGAASARHSPW